MVTEKMEVCRRAGTASENWVGEDIILWADKLPLHYLERVTPLWFVNIGSREKKLHFWQKLCPKMTTNIYRRALNLRLRLKLKVFIYHFHRQLVRRNIKRDNTATPQNLQRRLFLLQQSLGNCPLVDYF